MSTAHDVTTPVTDNVVLGSAPDSWGVWFLDDEHQLPWDRFLDELTDAGYSWVELGPYGYLPTEPVHLVNAVGEGGLKVSGGTVFGALHRAQEWDRMVSVVSKVAELTAAVFIPPMFRDEKNGQFSQCPTLDDDAWKTLTHAANELGKRLAQGYDIQLCLHSHADSHIQTQPEIERFRNGTDPDFVSLCLDTGHVAYGGRDAVDLIHRYSERIGYVHIKQMDREVLRAVAENDLSFAEAVKRGVCVEPPTGDPNPASVIKALDAVDARVFVIVEQDLYPCDPDVPLPIAVRTRKYLNRCGLSAGHQRD